MRCSKPLRFWILLLFDSNQQPPSMFGYTLFESWSHLSSYQPWSSLTPRTPYWQNVNMDHPGHQAPHRPLSNSWASGCSATVPSVAVVLGPSWAWRRRRYAEAAGVQALYVLSRKEERFTWATWIWKENMYENVFFKRHPHWLHEMNMMQFSACFINGKASS